MIFVFSVCMLPNFCREDKMLVDEAVRMFPK